MNILIVPSAKLVDVTLQSFFGRIPSALIPLEGKCSYEYIYEKYERFYDVIIIVGHEEFERLDKLIDHSKYPKIQLIRVPKIYDIGFTIHYAMQYINLSKVNIMSINYADTLINDISIEYLNQSTIVVSHFNDNNRWAFLDRTQNELFIFNEQCDNNNKSEEAVAGFFNFTSPSLLYQSLSSKLTALSTNDESFYEAIIDYDKIVKMHVINTKHWLDFGHSDNYLNLKREVDSRFFNSIHIDSKRGILTKTSTDKSKLINEILWYLKLPNDLLWLTPRIFSYSTDSSNPYIKMEYYTYNTLQDIFLFSNYNLAKWNSIFTSLFEILKDFKQYKLQLDKTDLSNTAFAMYSTKTRSRILHYDKTVLSKFLTEGFTCNGILYPSISILVDEIDRLLKLSGAFDLTEFCIIHGDFFFANMIIDPSSNIVRLIDPRGDFGGYGIYGDPMYDYAKLAHSVDGLYDFIVKDLFILDVEDNQISYSIKCDDNHIKIKNLFYSFFTSDQVTLLKLIQCTLFLSMIPLHNDHPRRQYVMLGTAMRLLSEVFDGTKK